MARITVEDCLTKETNRFALIHLASRRAKQVLDGARLLLDEKRDNKAVVSALREIAAGKVRFMTAEEVRRQKELEAEALEAQRIQAEQALALAAPVAPSVIASDGGEGSGGTEEPGELNDGTNLNGNQTGA